MQNLRVGSPLDKSNDIGALVDPVQQQRIHGLVEAARAEGCESGSRPAKRRSPARGTCRP
jgi:acyl-CoA reductase-like NAD-dependent aldehyde dehydrogenase